jgi:hypothetical protein
VLAEAARTTMQEILKSAVALFGTTTGPIHG